MRADVGEMHVMSIEPLFVRGIELIPCNLSMTDDKAVDIEVEWLVMGSVFGCQRVNDKLKIGLTFGRSLIEIGF